MKNPPIESKTRVNNLNRRQFLNLVAGGAAAAMMSPAGCQNQFARAAKPEAKRPNILFIMVDDLGPEWLSCYGGEEMKTPNIDKLAEGGMQFSNAYSMAQCTPTRTTLLTGQYPFRHGWVNHWDVPRWGAGCHFDPRHNFTFARVLKTAGYATAAAGKWQINDFRVQPDAMQQHGFDEHCMWTGYESENPPSANRYWDPYINTNKGSRTYKGKFGTDVFTDFLIDFMKRHKDSPMMLYFPYTDHAVGRLVKALDGLNIRNNTIIFFTTDNGSSRGISARMNGRLVKGGKATIGEPGVRAPFIANCPGLVPAGVRTDALTDFTDMFPTFAELAAAKIPTDVVLDGRSIARLILGKADDSPRDWIMAMGFGAAKLADGRVIGAKEYANRVVRNKRHKLWLLDGKPAKFFDILADPAETNNLLKSNDPDVIAARKKLQAVARSFPEKDGVPKYDHTPPQPWDKKPNRSKKKKLKN
ncbi:MAG: sulfatase-like hydrolase/transferase [Planctomycetota bacterium]|jgi:arylsulfatase A-like enzyme